MSEMKGEVAPLLSPPASQLSLLSLLNVASEVQLASFTLTSSCANRSSPTPGGLYTAPPPSPFQDTEEGSLLFSRESHARQLCPFSRTHRACARGPGWRCMAGVDRRPFPTPTHPGASPNPAPSPRAPRSSFSSFPTCN